MAINSQTRTRLVSGVAQKRSGREYGLFCNEYLWTREDLGCEAALFLLSLSTKNSLLFTNLSDDRNATKISHLVDA